MLQRLGGRAEYADRVTLGTIELIVRDVDEGGRIVSVGLSFEPTPAVTSIPAFLSPGELADRFRALLKRLRSGKPSVAVVEEEKPDSYNSRGN
jgi:cell volume regulation protein A